MLGAVEGNNNISAIRLFNATNAFSKSNPVKSDSQPQSAEAGTEIIENSILKDINVDEIKQYANSVGETNLSEEDIKYGLRFGRSVLINYSA